MAQTSSSSKVSNALFGRRYTYINTLLVIDETMGVVRVAPNVSLDREKQPSYTFTVIAADQPQGSEEQKRTSALVLLTF